jgi:hypothetical protein
MCSIRAVGSRGYCNESNTAFVAVTYVYCMLNAAVNSQSYIASVAYLAK